MKRAVLVPTPAFAVAGVVVAMLVAVAATGGFLAGRLTADRAGAAEPARGESERESPPQQDKHADLIGATMSEVRRTLGAPKKIHNDSFTRATVLHDATWVYDAPGGGLTLVHFHEGRVVQVVGKPSS